MADANTTPFIDFGVNLFKFEMIDSMSSDQLETLASNFVKRGVIYHSVDVHTMLDCGPSQPTRGIRRPNIGMNSTVVLAKRLIVREEFFGATIFNLDTHTIAYVDHDGAHLIEAAQMPVLLQDAMPTYWDADRAISAASDLVEAGVMLVDDNAPQLIRFFAAQNLSENHLQSPFIVELEMTHACYRRCEHCAYDAAPDVDRTNELSTDQWKRIITNIAESGVASIRFTGGDFLFRQDAVDLMSFTDKLGISFHFLSDTVALSEKYVEAVSGFKNLAYIGTSIDGANAGEHDFLRGAGAFETLLRRVQRLTSAGLKMSLGTTLHKGNFKSVRETGRLATSLGATYFELGFLSPIGRGQNLQHLVLGGSEIREALSLYLEGVAAEEYSPMQVHYVNRAQVENPFHDIESIVERLPYQTEWPFSRLRVRPNGSAYTAGKLKNSSLAHGYNLLHVPLAEIWRSSPNLVKLRELGKGRRLHSLDFDRLRLEDVQ